MKTSALLLTAIVAFTFHNVRAQEGEHPIAAAVASKLSKPKQRFTMIVRAKVKEGEVDKFIAAFASAVPTVRKEPGCSRYELNRSADDPRTFLMYERWGNLQRLKDHLAAPHTKLLLETITPLLESPPEIHVLTPAAEPPKPAAKPAGATKPADAKNAVEAADPTKPEAK